MKRKNSKNIIWWGFISILLLMAPVVILSLYQLSIITHKMELIVNESSIKTQLTQQMHHAINARSNSLMRMLNQMDTFKLDEERTRMGELAEQFIKARQELLQLPLSEQEKKALQNQADITRVRSLAQRQVANLFVEGYRLEASKLLFKVALPNQVKVHNELEKIIKLQQQKSEQQLIAAQQLYQKTIIAISVSSILAILLALFICHIISSRVANTENNYQLINRLLHRAMEHAETANKTQTEFLANMSHELRTPLHGILSYAILGRDKIADVPLEKLKRFFSNIQISGERLLNLLNDLLEPLAEG